MTDYELLELAAKAAGILPLPPGKELDTARDGGLMICGGGAVDRWNPLVDDGDSRRLQIVIGAKAWYERNAAPELKLPRECGLAVVGDRWWAVNPTGEMSPAEVVRRAVVLAAAEIGRSMP